MLPGPFDGLAEKQLLLRGTVSPFAAGVECIIPAPGVIAPMGAYDLRTLWNSEPVGRCADIGGAMSKPAVDEEPRPKFGCAGRDGASDMREPDWERECVYGAAESWRFEAEVERFMADAGMGIADRFGFRPPRVYGSCLWLAFVYILRGMKRRG
jgi:hypothetical protein